MGKVVDMVVRENGYDGGVRNSHAHRVGYGDL